MSAKGKLFAIGGGLLLVAASAQAMDPELVYAFQYTLESRWTYPYASLVEGTDHKFYSTT
jgi:hypothetical protein